MTMRIVAKFYPITDEEVARAKNALEEFKRDVLAPRGAYVDGLVVTEGLEPLHSVEVGVEHMSGCKVVFINGYVHLDK